MLRFSDVVWLSLGLGLLIVTVVYGIPFYKGDKYAPTVKMAYIYYNASNLTIYCNTSARQSRFLAGGIMITTNYNTTLIKGGYKGYSRHNRPFYLKFTKVLDTAPYNFYFNSTVTCWGSNGSYGIRSFRVKRITDVSLINVTADAYKAPIIVNETDLVETPDVALRWWPQSQQNQIVMSVLLTQLVFVVFIINACLIWSCKFKRHK
ncbi:membrane protein UL120 [Cercopithecine betaherpesvirus 5]|uniref:Membrane protein UL120 n=1 Tax=Simian cytomegalovirus (strain Colburn) TaxID=50292 RepID=G8XTH4_SCMVC|nr:membrane protein UL120 [Cercopithecine betaherpesvirus 5]AEV80466.1 membrane protein UL120 [Cercopithecine betaherpesvirus 5]